MSREFRQKILKGERPLPAQRREMIRIIVKDIRKVCPVPKKKQLELVAQRIVKEYPKSFKDTILDGKTTLGSGYSSILKSLSENVSNSNRGNKASPRSTAAVKPNASGDASKAKATDSYGCINYKPDLPTTDDAVEENMQKKEQMKAMFKRGIPADEASESMKDTYSLQRRDIIDKDSISDIQTEWPYLFTEERNGKSF